MSFFYFIATQSQKPFQQEIDNSGLAYAIEAGKVRWRCVLNGPDGQRGLILCRTEDVLYKPSEQVWQKINDKAWIGYQANAKISAGDLQRESMVSGERVEMANGEIWLAAHARKFTELEEGSIVSYCSLPRSLALVDGKWVPSTIQKRFRLFQELAEAYQAAAYEAVEASNFANDTVLFQFDRLDDFAVLAITANYHASHIELSILEAYDVETRKRLISAAMDENTFLAWQNKKKELGQDGSVSSVGQEPLTLAPGL